MSEKYRPEQIYLQVTDDDGEALDVDTEEITWCADDQHQGDIKYIRADIVSKLEAVVEAVKAHNNNTHWSFSMHGADLDPQTWSDVKTALADLEDGE